LNDIGVGGDGSLYITDSGLEQWGPYVEPNGKDAIYRLLGEKVVPLVSGKALGNPNGVAHWEGRLVVVNKGGQVLSIDADGMRTEIVKTPKGSLDGVVATPQGLLVSSWDAKAVYLVDGKGATPIVRKLDSPADIGFDAKRGRLLIPQPTLDALRIQPLPAGSLR
jgi:sugar lactone lactonase YvrE